MPPRAGLFVTCLIDVIRPSIGFAAARLIEASGCGVAVPDRQTCCGQPAFNAGDRATSRALALQTVRAFQDCDVIVTPSGSCAAMLKHDYPALLADADAATASDVQAFAGRVYELTQFLADVRQIREVPGRYQGRITYHDSCSGLRSLGIKSAPRRLLAMMPGVDLVEMREPEACCGFGGLFAFKYGGISDAIVARKTEGAAETGAPLLTGGDLGCLMNIAGKLSRGGQPMDCRHVAEILAGEFSDPPIGRGCGRAP